MRTTTSLRSHIAVVGGGFTGMVCALRLLEAGYDVTVLEGQSDIGGLTSAFNFGPFCWDKFYHCILTSDNALLRLIDDLGLSGRLRWTKTQVGLFSRGSLHRMTSPVDLLRYRHLPLLSKVRLALMSLYVKRIKDGRALELQPLCQWTRKLFGKRVYEQIWEPLFRCKLGESRRHASAAFLWATLVRLASTRERGPGQQEQLGYLSGGYDTLFKQLQYAVVSLRGSTHMGVKIRAISSDASGCVHIRTSTRDLSFDGVVLTVPNKVIAGLLDTDDTAYKERLGEVLYLGMICVVLVLRRRLSSFYVTNVAEKIGFTGVIEMTNLIDPAAETQGRHLVYLPRYTSPSDPLFEAEDEEIWRHVRQDLAKIHPDLSDTDIESRFVFRERTVQPVPTVGYSDIVPPARTPVANVYIANTAQIMNNTLNNNAMTSIAEATCRELRKDIPVQRRAQTASSASGENMMSPELTR